ncbi:MAG: hypothetical protein AAFY71_17540 [Bacteroidota bacterium]
MEQFDNNDHKWNLVQGRKITTKIEEGKLAIASTAKSAGTFILLPMPSKEMDEDFTLEVTLTQTKGAKNMAYGLVWCAKEDQSDFQGFFLSSNGKYTLLSCQRNRFSEIKRWTESRLVNNTRRPNHLKISKKGDLYIYYLNGKRIFANKISKSVGKGMGIALYGRMKLEVDNMLITKPAPQKKKEEMIMRKSSDAVTSDN